MNSETIDIHQIRNNKEREVIFKIRHEVFVIGQSVDPEEEYDEYENTSVHYIAYLNNQPVGTARWRETQMGIKMERFAVLNKARGKGVGDALVKHLLKEVDSTKKIYLNAQITAIELYARNNFKVVGKKFIEANIEHYKMVWEK